RARRAIPSRARTVAAPPRRRHGRDAGPGPPRRRPHARDGGGAADGRAPDPRDPSRPRLLMDADTSLAPFAREVSRPPAACDLGRAALVIAKSEYPHLDVDVYAGKLAALADGAMAVRAVDPLGRLHRLREYLFEEQGFAGNSGDYFDPRNSYLND